VKILLAGAAGQLGRALVDALESHELDPLGSKQLDVTDLPAVRATLSARRPELVVNCSGWTDVDGAEAEPEAAFRLNALGPRNLALAARETGAALLHVSTDYVFDGEGDRPYCEFDATRPLSVYGRSKLAGEEAVREANERHFIVRTAWLYSTRGRNFALTMRGLAERPEVRVVSDQFGSPTYAPHLARAIGELVASGTYGTYHLAGRGVASWWELTCALYRELGVHTPVRAVSTAEFPRPARRPRYAPLTTVQSPEILLPSWEEGVRAFASDLARETAG
jgi:dTDP-4-dehydrorhamnose reductase